MDRFIDRPSPKDRYTRRIFIKSGDYQGVVLDYWNATIISALENQRVSHEIQYEYSIEKIPENFNIRELDKEEFKSTLTDFIVQSIHDLNGTLPPVLFGNN